jgi:class 3 adenylate cyclase
MVSQVVHESLRDADRVFRDLGDHALKGLPGRWRLYESVPGQLPDRQS